MKKKQKPQQYAFYPKLSGEDLDALLRLILRGLDDDHYDLLKAVVESGDYNSNVVAALVVERKT